MLDTTHIQEQLFERFGRDHFTIQITADGIPTLWVWQIAWWIIGCVMMYLLAFKLEMSTVPEKEVANPSQGD